MGLLGFLRRAEKRAVIPLSGASVGDVEGMRHAFGPDHLNDTAGQAVAERCRSIISQTTAAVPLPIYRRTNGGRQEARDHSLWRVLNDESSDGVPAFRFREALARDVARYGNGVARIIRNGHGEVDELVHLPWRMVLCEALPNGRWRYRYTDPAGRQHVLLPSEVVHIRYSLSSDGFTGIDPLALARTSTALVAAQAELALAQVQRGFVPDVAFETDGTFDDANGPAAFDRLKKQLTERLGRMWRNPTALLLEAGIKAKPLAAPGREQQFHESRVLGLEDLARAYGVPLSIVGLGKQSSYGSLNEEARSLVKYCIGPWSKLLEDELRVALLTREERAAGLEIVHDLTGLLRGDTETEMKALQTAVGGPFLAPDEAREWLGYNRTEGGATVRFPLNMAPPAGGTAQT